jgi:hypothetical protein
MSLRGCVTPLVVRLCGVPNDERLAQMSDAIARTVASRLGAADRVIAVREGWPAWRRTHATPQIRFNGAPLDNDLRQRVVAAIEAGITRAVTGAPAAGRPAAPAKSSLSPASIIPVEEDAPTPVQWTQRVQYVVYFTEDPKYGIPARIFIAGYYPKHREIHAGSFEEAFERVSADLEKRRAEAGKDRVVIDELVLVTHANTLGGLQIPFLHGGQEIFNPLTLSDFQGKLIEHPEIHRRFLKARSRMLAGLDDGARLVVRGCNFGDSAIAMQGLRDFFGGRVLVFAPKGYQGYEVVPIGPQSIFKSREEAFRRLNEWGLLPDDEEGRKRFDKIVKKHGGVPLQFLVAEKNDQPDAEPTPEDLGASAEELAKRAGKLREKHVPANAEELLRLREELLRLRSAYERKGLGSPSALDAIFGDLHSLRRDVLAAKLKALGKQAKTEAAEPFITRPDIQEPGGDLWPTADPVRLDPELDALTEDELVRRAKELWRDYKPENAAMILRLRRLAAQTQGISGPSRRSGVGHRGGRIRLRLSPGRRRNAVPGQAGAARSVPGSGPPAGQARRNQGRTRTDAGVRIPCGR